MTIEFEKTLPDGPLVTYGAGPGGWIMFRSLHTDLKNHWPRADMRLSKSRYLKGLQCPKILWLVKNKPDEFDAGAMDRGALDYGHQIGEVAKSYFGDYEEVPFMPGDFEGMELRTTELLERGVPVICEATFKAQGCLCMVDILRVDSDGAAHVVEVKASKRLKDINLHDVAFQVWVLRMWGLRVKSATLMHVYGFEGEEGPGQQVLFAEVDVTEQVEEMQESVSANIEKLRRWASLKNEPGVRMGGQCDSPYPCGFKAWCAKCEKGA